MHKFLLICLASMTLVVNAAGQDYQSADDLQREVSLLLLDKNINDITRQLDSESPTTVASLLRRLVIYSRAGQTSRVRKTLQQLPFTANWQCLNHEFRWLIRNAGGGDLGSRRFYYERLCPDDIEGAEEFVRLWSSNGDLKGLDEWLAARFESK